MAEEPIHYYLNRDEGVPLSQGGDGIYALKYDGSAYINGEDLAIFLRLLQEKARSEGIDATDALIALEEVVVGLNSCAHWVAPDIKEFQDLQKFQEYEEMVMRIPND